MLVVWIFKDLRSREGVFTFETVVVASRGAEDAVWLLHEPCNLGARQNDFRFARHVRYDVGRIVLAILSDGISGQTCSAGCHRGGDGTLSYPTASQSLTALKLARKALVSANSLLESLPTHGTPSGTLDTALRRWYKE